ncbi:helix-turn-helix transcriptional regulator [Microbacterium sp. Leaf320]|uniref:helix-turn-helix transcriptional regulator n=1 Tax=Microbacterium sp. Leaf320 TaxID=1736334 RepID=UPI000B0E6DF3|nr:LuxR C-terminal-related transcriptional regulator [Microbacterium sp. Leaf320]
MEQDPGRRARGARLPLHMLDRPRLTEVFDRGHALTVVSGPAGGGKSVLLSQWAAVQDSRGIASVRLGFDENMTNEHLMLRDILAQLVVQDLIADRSGARSTLRGFDSVRDPADELGRLLGELSRDCVIMIDNAERVDETSLLRRALDLLDAAPLLRIVVATRRSTVTRTLQMLVSADVCVIGPAHLFFTRDEARDVVERVSAQKIPPHALGDESALPLAARALGLTIATQSAPVEIAAIEVQELADALMAGLIGADAPADFEEFLLRTSIPGRVTREIAERLGWPDGGAEHLDRAELYGLGMWEAGADGLAFLYTPLLREALVRRLDQRSSESVAPIRRTVALWASENGRHLEALTNALRAKDYVLATRLGRKSWFILSRSSPQDVEALLRRENPVVLARHPLLGMLLALVLLRLGQRLRAFAYFQGAALSLRRRGLDDDPVERFWMLSAKTLAERFAGQFRRSGATADLVVAAYGEMDAEQRAECTGFAALLLSNCGLSFLQLGRISDAVEVLELGMTIHVAHTVVILEDGVGLRMPDDGGGWYHCAAALAGAYALRGRLSDARRVLEEIDDADPPPAWRTEQFGILEQIAHAIVAVAALDLAEARHRTDSIAHHLGTTELWPYLVCIRSEIDLRDGHPAEASRLLTHALGRGVNSAVSDHGSSRLAFAQAMTSLSMCDQAAARRAVAALPADEPPRKVIEALVALLTRDDPHAFAAAEVAQVERDPDLDRACLAALITATAAARLGRHEAAARAASWAVAVMREEHSYAPLALFGTDVLRELRDLCAAAEREYLDSYLSRASETGPFPALPPPVRLTSRELAVMRELRRTSSTDALAAALFVSPNTVKVQRRSAYRKLGASNREQALLRAAELGLLDE